MDIRQRRNYSQLGRVLTRSKIQAEKMQAQTTDVMTLITWSNFLDTKSKHAIMMVSRLFSFSCLNLNSRFRGQNRTPLHSRVLMHLPSSPVFLPSAPLLSSPPKSRGKGFKTRKTKYLQNLDNPINSEKYYRVEKGNRRVIFSKSNTARSTAPDFITSLICQACLKRIRVKEEGLVVY